jgi:hypothetical protein
MRVISGGQTGADLGGLLGAQAAGIKTGGTAPPRWMTEKGPAPHILRPLGLVEGEPDPKTYPKRTEKNIMDSDGTAIFGNIWEAGTALTSKLCKEHGKPVIINPTVYELLNFILDHQIETLNVAGNRESRNPGLQERVQKVVSQALAWVSVAREVLK